MRAIGIKTANKTESSWLFLCINYYRELHS